LSTKLPGDGNGFWEVCGESMAIYGGDDSSKHRLLCCDRVACELEKAGIVNFSGGESPKT